MLSYEYIFKLYLIYAVLRVSPLLTHVITDDSLSYQSSDNHLCQYLIRMEAFTIISTKFLDLIR